ncbi:MAG TPA: serine/threonine-protein kinase [Kofleriaceae bacterium]|nr:serine/threonine-protein kinase [Kofleriaceae bacterium]
MIGTQIGAYRIVEQIGEGGMGAVYRAEHVMIGRAAAVKVLHPMFGARPDIVARFFNEARAATQVSDPGIVQIFDFGQAADGRAYIVMELLDGEPLDQRLARAGALPVGDTLRIMRQVASSLGAAHARGIIHRDLKPENIFLARDPEVAGGMRAKLLDFGIAKLTQDQTGPKTNTQAMIGTPAYMSPEQCRGAGQVDQRADIYSLGCVLVKLLTGAPPFDAFGAGELIVMHMQVQPQPPSARMPGIPAELDQLVLRCLDKDPARRYSSGSELAVALDALLSRISTAPSAMTTPAMTTPAMSTPLAYPHTPAPTTLSSGAGVSLVTSVPRKSRTGVWIGGAIVVVAVAAGLAVVVSGGDKAPVAAAPPTPVPAPAPPPPVAKPTPPAAPAPTNRDNAIAQIRVTIEAFHGWTKAHPRDACPTSDELGAAADPWGGRLVITCTDQPGDQIVGVMSPGPDGKLGTGDDLESWALGADIAQLARGPRWHPAPAAQKPVIKAHPKPQPATNDDDTAIPDHR